MLSGRGPALGRATILSLVVASLVVASPAVDAHVRTPDPDRHRASAASDWHGWVTSPTEPGRRLLAVRPVAASPTAHVIVDQSRPRQRWHGVGASLTDASVGLLQDNREATELLFSPDRADGARLSWVRLPLSSTDFSTRAWSWTASGAPPAESVAAARYLTEQVLPLRRDLGVVATPWSAPASMKQPTTLRGGQLRGSAEGPYGDLLVRQATWLRAQGIPIKAMTLGNEPGNSADYTTMEMSTAQQARLANAVSPRLETRSVQLWAVDHNWSDRPAYDAVLSAAPGAFAAAAVHCYDGTPGQMAELRVRTFLTECTGTDDTWPGTFRWDALNLVTRAIDAGSTGLMMWNLALDAYHGPVDPWSTEGCKNCRGLLTIAGHTVTPGPEFYTLAHVARAARPGARVVPAATEGPVVASAFHNADGTIAIVGHNESSSEEVVDVRVRGRSGVRFRVGPGELFTFTGTAEAPAGALRDAVVATPTGALLHIDEAGFRHPITDPAIAACLPEPSRTTTSVARFPLGEAAGCRPRGHVVYSSPDGASYLVVGSRSRPRRRWMPTAAAYFCAVDAGYPVVRGPTYVVKEMAVGEDLPESC